MRDELGTRWIESICGWSRRSPRYLKKKRNGEAKGGKVGGKG